MNRRRIAILSRGDQSARELGEASSTQQRFANLYAALRAAGHDVESAVYDESFSDVVRQQLLAADLVLVWVNPIDDGRDRSDLDAMLREVAGTGVTVSAHPDVVLALGTKRVLYETREFGWGCDTRLYSSPDQLVDGLTASLATGPRVLKQHRGSSGAGVWRVELLDSGLRVRHATRGSEDELISLPEFLGRCTSYFDAGIMIDQAFQARLPEGMVRCYLVRDQVAGFGVQAINALVDATPGTPPPTPTARTYHPPTLEEFQDLKHELESQWVPQLQVHFALDTDQLPLLWDCDFLRGPLDGDGNDTWVLCEINVSSVSPYPESVVPEIVARLR